MPFIRAYKERDWYPLAPGADSPVEHFYRWLTTCSEDEYRAMRRGETFRGTGLCRSDGERRALNLLRRHLTEEQWQCLSDRRHFWVTGTMRRYGRMRKHRFQVCPYGVFEYDSHGRRHFCIVTLEPGLPEADWMLAVKLLIESNLKKFFATAKTRGWQAMVPCNQFD